jgi:hypothetical protein
MCQIAPLQVSANRKMPARIVNTNIEPVLQWFKFDKQQKICGKKVKARHSLKKF